MSHLLPILGIESATISLIEALQRDYDLQVAALAGEAPRTFQETLVSYESWGRKVTGWKRIFTVARAFRHRNEFNRSVIVLSGAWAAIPMLLVLPKAVRSRVIVWEHSFDREKVKSDKSLRILRATARRLYGRARAVITVSDSLRRDMFSAGFGGVIEVIPNIIREFDSTEASDVVPGRLLAIGSLTKTKNQSLALRSLALLPARFSLVILGDGPERGPLERLAAGLGLADRVVFCGYVSNPATYFAQAQFLIHPSVGETYGLVLFEAAASGMPVVAADQSVMAELIPKLVPGVVVPPQPTAFADAILSLEATPVCESAFSEAAAERESMSRNIISDWRKAVNAAAAAL